MNASIVVPSPVTEISMPRPLLTALLCALFPSWTAHAADDAQVSKPAPAAKELSVEKLATQAKNAIVVITHENRQGGQRGIGTGFVIDAKGLIATNYHVIGESRPIKVQLADGKTYDVTHVHASDRKLDLAIVRIDAEGLTALPLGDSDTLKQGRRIVAMGNPHGLKHSIVEGVVSSVRDVGDVPMVQLAIPIEPGNSGGPMLDRQGRVHGILTLKSAVTDNLGFAMPINVLKPLIEKPNPIPISEWVKIGQMDPSEWKPLFNARWRQRAGRILVDGTGQGFGGRSLCVFQKAPPKRPYEVAVTVKLDDESGAAGLMFESDGKHKHYGFYPSNGRIRLTLFDGPDVYSWHVLKEIKTEHYKPGDWNVLRVRVEKDTIIGYVNDEKIVEVKENSLTGGKAGLAKFRRTVAQFKGFEVAKQIAPSRVPAKVAAQIEKQLKTMPNQGELPQALIDTLRKQPHATEKIIQQRAKLLEQQAAQLRALARTVHYEHCAHSLGELFSKKKDEEVDLFRAALLIALIDNHELDIDEYRHELKRMASQIKTTLPKDADEKTRRDALNNYLFKQNGYHGSRTDYYNKSNSYINEVIDDREGLPITLSVLYMELGRQLDLNIVGVGLPGHFIVRHEPQKGKPQLIDPFNSGNLLTRKQAVDLVFDMSGYDVEDHHFKAVSKRDIVLRMLNNLMRTAFNSEGETGPLRYLNAILAVDPNAARERWARMMLRARTQRFDAALADADWLIEHQPAELDIHQVQRFREAVIRQKQ